MKNCIKNKKTLNLLQMNGMITYILNKDFKPFNYNFKQTI